MLAITFKFLPFSFSPLSPTRLILGVWKASIFEIVLNYIFTEDYRKDNNVKQKFSGI